jgi:hypothetical protein
MLNKPNRVINPLVVVEPAVVAKRIVAENCVVACGTVAAWICDVNRMACYRGYLERTTEGQDKVSV